MKNKTNTSSKNENPAGLFNTEAEMLEAQAANIPSNHELRYTGKTIADTINNLAEAFSGTADTAGLFILEQALEKAKELRSQQQRFDEANAIFADLNS